MAFVASAAQKSFLATAGPNTSLSDRDSHPGILAGVPCAHAALRHNFRSLRRAEAPTGRAQFWPRHAEYPVGRAMYRRRTSFPRLIPSAKALLQSSVSYPVLLRVPRILLNGNTTDRAELRHDKFTRRPYVGNSFCRRHIGNAALPDCPIVSSSAPSFCPLRRAPTFRFLLLS